MSNRGDIGARPQPAEPADGRHAEHWKVGYFEDMSRRRALDRSVWVALLICCSMAEQRTAPDDLLGMDDSEHRTASSSVWLRRFISEDLPTLQLGLAQASDLRQELSHTVTIGRFTREAVRLEQVVARADGGAGTWDAAQAISSSLSHAQEDLRLAATGPGDMREREALLRAARLRLRIARTLSSVYGGD